MTLRTKRLSGPQVWSSHRRDSTCNRTDSPAWAEVKGINAPIKSMGNCATRTAPPHKSACLRTWPAGRGGTWVSGSLTISRTSPKRRPARRGVCMLLNFFACTSCQEARVPGAVPKQSGPLQVGGRPRRPSLPEPRAFPTRGRSGIGGWEQASPCVWRSSLGVACGILLSVDRHACVFVTPRRA